MVRFLVNIAIFVGSAALGLWITSLILEDFKISGLGIIVCVLIFAALQSILSPLIFKLTRKYANAFTGGVGLVSTFIALLVTSMVSTNLSIDGTATWLASTLLVWLITAVATWVLPMIFLRNQVQKRKS